MGSRLARELLDHGYALICPVRDPSSPSAMALRDSAASNTLRFISTELTDRERLLTDLEDARVDALVSCVASRRGGIADSQAVEYGINHSLLDWAQEKSVARFMLLSAICVQKPRLAFQFAKLRFEKELMDSGLDHAIIRPTAFFKSLSGQLSRVRGGKPFLTFGNGDLTRCKPIAEGDLARFMRETLEDSGRSGLLPVGGPGPALSPLDQVELLERLLGRTVATRRVPPTLLLAAANVLSIPGVISSAMADKAEFARIGHYYATESMLLWDPSEQRYDEDATPSYGAITLRESYAAQLQGLEQQHAGSHAVFKR